MNNCNLYTHKYHWRWQRRRRVAFRVKNISRFSSLREWIFFLWINNVTVKWCTHETNGKEEHMKLDHTVCCSSIISLLIIIAFEWIAEERGGDKCASMNRVWSEEKYSMKVTINKKPVVSVNYRWVNEIVFCLACYVCATQREQRQSKSRWQEQRDEW